MGFFKAIFFEDSRHVVYNGEHHHERNDNMGIDSYFMDPVHVAHVV